MTVYSWTLCEYECVHVCVKLKQIFFFFPIYSISCAYLSLSRLILSAVKNYWPSTSQTTIKSPIKVITYLPICCHFVKSSLSFLSISLFPPVPFCASDLILFIPLHDEGCWKAITLLIESVTTLPPLPLFGVFCLNILDFRSVSFLKYFLFWNISFSHALSKNKSFFV